MSEYDRFTNEVIIYDVRAISDYDRFTGEVIIYDDGPFTIPEPGILPPIGNSFPLIAATLGAAILDKPIFTSTTLNSGILGKPTLLFVRPSIKLNLTFTTTTANQIIAFNQIDVALDQTCRIEWGDGSSTLVSGTGQTPSKTYAVAGAYPVTIHATHVVDLRLFSKGGVVSGNLSTWVIPPDLLYINISANSLSGDISSWIIPSGLTQLRLNNNAFSGTPDFSKITDLNTFRYNNNSLSTANVDAVVAAIYARRAHITFGSPAMLLHGTNAAPSGILQANCPTPLVGKEQIFHLRNDPCGEGFSTWTIFHN